MSESGVSPPGGGERRELAAGCPGRGHTGRFGRLVPVVPGRLGAGLLAAALIVAVAGLAAGATAGTEWLPVEVVAQTPSVSSEPAVAVAPDGTVWVAWQDGGDVLVARDTGGGWSAAERVGTGFGADIALAGDVPHVVFISDLADQLDVVYSYRDRDGWALPRTVSGTVSLGSGPALAVAGTNRLLVWSDSDFLMMGRSIDGAVWSVQPVLINRLPVTGIAPDVAADAGGGVDLVWHVVVDGVERIRHAEWYGGRWSLAEDLSSPGEVPARSPSLAVLPDGERLVAWLAGQGSDGRAVQATMGTTGWWSPPATISGAAVPAGSPQTAGHEAGADVAWLAEAGGARFRTHRLGSGWLPEEPVTTDAVADLALASSAVAAHVAWSAPVEADNWDIALRRRAVATWPTPTRSPETTPTASATATVSLVTATRTATATAPATTTATNAATGRVTPTGTAPTTPSASATPPTLTATATATVAASPVGTVTPRPTPNASPTRTPTLPASPTATRRATAPPSPSATPTRRPSATATATGRTLFLPWTTIRRTGRAATRQRPGATGPGTVTGAGGAAAGPPAAPGAISGLPEIWSAPEDIAHLPGTSWQLALALDAKGQPHVMWADGAPLRPDLRHSARVAGHWQEPRHVAYGEAPALAVDAGGTLHALFANSFDDNQDIYFVTYRDGEWSLPENVSGTSTHSTAPVLRTGDAAAPLVATWSELAPTGPLVYYAWWDGDWHFQPVSQARGQGSTVVLDDAGPVLAWHGRAAADRPFDVYASRGQDYRGRAWSLPENVSDTADEDSMRASVALDPSTWHLAWREGPATAVGVAYARRYGAGWGEVEMLDAASSGPPQVLAAPGGAREVVWLNEPAVWSARSFGVEPGWRKATVPATDAGAMALAAVSGPDGSLHLAWIETSEGGSAVIRYARRLGCTACRAMVPLAVRHR